MRDNRGKRHDLAVVLTGVTLALLCNRDGSLSSIHRHLVKHFEKLTEVLGVERKRAVSRSQLPLILAQVSLTAFAGVLREEFGLKLQEDERQWFAVDGKELRGSIEGGATRGAAVVQIVAHESQASVAQDYYHGAKESEVPVVRDLLAASGVLGQKVSLDALHCKPDTLEPIAAGVIESATQA